MDIHRIDTVRQFDELKSEWQRAYEADPHAHIFVSWQWLRGWFEITPYQWFVLAARDEEDGHFVAFFPLAVRSLCICRVTVLRELRMGGKPFADYAGIVCMPGYEASAIAAFGGYIKNRLKWDYFHLCEVVDPRLDDFISQFSGRRWKVTQGQSLPCPYISLAETWDAHLMKNVNGRTRAGVRRAFKRVEMLPEFHVTEPTESDLVQHIGTLITLWESRWGRMPSEVKDRFEHMYGHLFKVGQLWLQILWSGPNPVAGFAAFADPLRRVVYAHAAVFNPKYADRSPGKAMLGYSLRASIEKGFTVYDLMLGGEKYKYSLGAKDRKTNSMVVIRRGLRSDIGRLLLWMRAIIRQRWGAVH